MSENKNLKGPKAPKPGGMGGPMNMSTEKPKNFKSTMSRFIKHLSIYKFKIIIVMIFSVASAAFSIGGPKILGNGISEIYRGISTKLATGQGGVDFKVILSIVITLLVLYFISVAFSITQAFIITGVAQKISYDFRKEISIKINKLPLKYFDTRTYGEVMSRVTNDVDTISQTLNQSISQIITGFATVIGILIMMLTISRQLTIVAILIIPLSLVFVMVIVKKSQKYFKKQQEYLGHINGEIEEVFGGQIVVKAFNCEDRVTDEFNKFNDTLFDSAWKSQFLSGIMMPIMGFIGNLGYVVVCIYGGYLTTQGKLNVGDITSFVTYLRTFNQPITQIAQVSNLLQSTAAAAERIFEFLDEDEEKNDATNPISIKNIKGNVNFENVSFGYVEDKIIINNFTAQIKQGQKVAIVGPTGAGKSTMVKLLMRFYDVNTGKIMIDFNNIKDFERDDLRGIFGMVLQDTWLFNGTIMENIRYGNLKATDEEVITAAKAANVHRFIKTLPNGYNMELNEEATNVSQGEKQLLTIARCILKDPKILILDEATSSVDTRTEVLIQKAMATLMKGRTSFIIAHRLSTIRDSDLILVMDKGDIVEQGNHEELLAKKGFYYNLYNSQFENSELA